MVTSQVLTHQITITPLQVGELGLPGNTCPAEMTFTVPGVQLGDSVLVSYYQAFPFQSNGDGRFIVEACVTGTDTVTVRVFNLGAAPDELLEEAYVKLLVYR